MARLLRLLCCVGIRMAQTALCLCFSMTPTTAAHAVLLFLATGRLSCAAVAWLTDERADCVDGASLAFNPPIFTVSRLWWATRLSSQWLDAHAGACNVLLGVVASKVSVPANASAAAVAAAAALLIDVKYSGSMCTASCLQREFLPAEVKAELAPVACFVKRLAVMAPPLEIDSNSGIIYGAVPANMPNLPWAIEQSLAAGCTAVAYSNGASRATLAGLPVTTRIAASSDARPASRTKRGVGCFWCWC